MEAGTSGSGMHVCGIGTSSWTGPAWSAVGNSDHVVRLVDVMAEPRAFYTVTERCESTIMAKISAMPELWALESQRMLKEMLHGVQACRALESLWSATHYCMQ